LTVHQLVIERSERATPLRSKTRAASQDNADEGRRMYEVAPCTVVVHLDHVNHKPAASSSHGE
jgi:hypothetical protein